MRAVSKKLNTAICGSIPFIDNGIFSNRFLWIDGDKEIQYYDKRHLFSYGKEDQYYTKGKIKKIIEFKGWKICPQICYDLRFPVWSRNVEDYDLMIYIANWPSKRVHAWSNLLKARAIENLSYVCGLNRLGKDGNDLFYTGQSAIVRQEGIEMVTLGDQESILTATLSKKALKDFRKTFQFLQDRDTFKIDE